MDGAIQFLNNWSKFSQPLLKTKSNKSNLRKDKILQYIFLDGKGIEAKVFEENQPDMTISYGPQCH